ncbi:MAG: hypothetical protein KAU50_11840, partial [Candidatus Marinimicrobia bacterium]|nr:hypothetical protein [Candidatus Neomarinimicrobiota bacterium]
MSVRIISRYLSVLLIFLSSAGAQVWHNHPELEWQTFESEHFLVHYHQGAERSAREALVAAENAFGPITRLYHYEPSSKTHVIIKDVDDVSNGVAYFYDNKIEIWARPLDYDLRGSHRWIQGVITHEFVHIIQMGASMKFTRRMPGMYLQGVGYEDERRDDVLYGYPNVLVSYAYPGVSVPPWFAEGVAQYMYAGANYDYWDTHRDMLLRERVLNGNLLSLPAMNSFGKRGIGNESVYNQGFAFVIYLADRFGSEVLSAVADDLAAPLSISVSRALKRATGADGNQLYREWQAELEDRYTREMARVKRNEVKGEIIINTGTASVHPVWHPTAGRFAYLSNGESDYFGQTALYIHDFETGKSEKISAHATSAPCWSADGATLYYTARGKPDKTGARWLDLYAYDLDSEKEERLTYGQRATSPVILSGDTSIAYLTVHDGTSNVMLYSLTDGSVAGLTQLTHGEYLYSLTWDPAGWRLITDATYNHGRELLQIDIDNGTIAPYKPAVPASGADNREPFRTGDGLLVSSNASGVFNLQKMGDDGTVDYVTNVTGGAFMPSANSAGQILYSLFEDGAYKIALLAEPPALADSVVGIAPDHYHGRPLSDQLEPDTTVVGKPYVEAVSRPFLIPRLMIDYGTIKPGFYFYATEVLDKLLMFGGASVNSIFD